MNAQLIQKKRTQLSDTRFVDVAIWRVSQPVPGSAHPYKYRLAYVVNETCVLRYDNETGKGDHRHVGATEVPYRFRTLEQLVDDFWADVARM